MSLNDLIPSTEEKKDSINKIVNRLNRRNLFVIKIVILIMVIFINLFPKIPNLGQTIKEDLNIIEMEETRLNLNNDLLSIQLTLQFTNTKDNGTLITGFDRYNDQENKTAFIIKQDNLNKVVWTYGGTEGIIVDDYLFYPFKAIELNDGSIVAFGTVKQEGKAFALVKLNPNGSFIDYHVLSKDQINELSMFNLEDPNKINNLKVDFIKSEDGGLTLFISQTQTLAIHLTNNYDVSWKLTVEYNMSEDFNVVDNVAIDQNGNHYLPVASSNKEYGNNMIIKISPTGVILWQKRYDFKIENIHNTKSNQLIVSGHQWINPKEIKKSVFLVFYDTLIQLGGKEFAITTEVDKTNGDLVWVDKINLKNRGITTIGNFTNLGTLEDKEGNLYSHLLEERGIYSLEYIIKYSKNGERMGGVILEPDDIPYNIFYKSRAKLVDNQFILINILYKTCRTTTIDQLHFSEIHLLNEDELETYNQLIIVRVWLNRVFLASFILYPIIKYKLYKYKMKKTIRGYITWN